MRTLRLCVNSLLFLFVISCNTSLYAAGGPPGHAAADKNAVKITEVIPNKMAGTITIKGKNFTKRSTIVVFLGDDPIPLEIIVMSTDNQITVRFDDLIVPGGYSLRVETEAPTNNDVGNEEGNPAASDEFDLNIP